MTLVLTPFIVGSFAAIATYCVVLYYLLHNRKQIGHHQKSAENRPRRWWDKHLTAGEKTTLSPKHSGIHFWHHQTHPKLDTGAIVRHKSSWKKSLDLYLGDKSKHFDRFVVQSRLADQILLYGLLTALFLSAFFSFFTLLLTLSWEWSALLSFFLAGFTIFQILLWRQRKWLRIFLEHFPDGLEILIRALQAGLPLSLGFHTVAKESPGPIAKEFDHIASQLALGMTLDKALIQASERIGAEEFHFFALAVSIHKQAGGQLTDTLRKIVVIIRDRQKLSHKIYTVTTHQRFSSLVVAFFPLLVLVLITALDPKNWHFFVYTPLGRVLLGVVVIQMVGGYFIMRRLMRIRI